MDGIREQIILHLNWHGGQLGNFWTHDCKRYLEKGWYVKHVEKICEGEQVVLLERLL